MVPRLSKKEEHVFTSSLYMYPTDSMLSPRGHSSSRWTVRLCVMKLCVVAFCAVEFCMVGYCIVEFCVVEFCAVEFCRVEFWV